MGDVDDAARVDHVIRRIKDARVCQPLPVFRAAQLVVGAAGDDPRPDPGNRVLVQDGPERTRRENVDVGRQDLVEAGALGGGDLRGRGGSLQRGGAGVAQDVRLGGHPRLRRFVPVRRASHPAKAVHRNSRSGECGGVLA